MQPSCTAVKCRSRQHRWTYIYIYILVCSRYSCHTSFSPTSPHFFFKVFFYALTYIFLPGQLFLSFLILEFFIFFLLDDRIVESGFHEVLEAALEQPISRYCSAMTVSAEHRAGKRDRETERQRERERERERLLVLLLRLCGLLQNTEP